MFCCCKISAPHRERFIPCSKLICLRQGCESRQNAVDVDVKYMGEKEDYTLMPKFVLNVIYQSLFFSFVGFRRGEGVIIV